MSCNCSPSSNLICVAAGNDNQYSFTQPTCVILPDETTVQNPYYDSNSSTSYWGYNLVVLCNFKTDLLPQNIFIPVYINLDRPSLSVFERILPCGSFEPVPYNFDNPPGIEPPDGFHFVSIPIQGRYGTATSVFYRFNVVGNYPQAQESTYIELSNNNTLSFNGNFLVPGEPQSPNLTVSKNSSVIISDNRGHIDYTVNITNSGNVTLSDVYYLDNINYDGANITIGGIDVDPDTIDVDTGTSGLIQLRGNIGDLVPGENFIITYSVPIISFRVPNTFVFSSITQASSENVLTSISTSAEIEAVEFETSNTCSVISSNRGSFTIGVRNLPNSPQSNINTENIITVPSGIVIQFNDFSNCSAYYLDTMEPVVLNTDVTNSQILISCLALLNPNGTTNFTSSFTMISTTSINPSLLNIVNSFNSVTLQNPSEQIIIDAAPLPNITSLEAGGEASCNNPCIP